MGSLDNATPNTNPPDTTNDTWPVWIVGVYSVPAQVWIRSGMLDADMLMPGDSTLLWCNVMNGPAAVGPGIGTMYYRDEHFAQGDGISATAKRQGHAAIRAAWMRQVQDHYRTLQDALQVLETTCTSGSLLDVPRYAREVEDAAALLSDIASHLGGWIAIEGGPTDPLCLAYDAAASTLIGGIGGPPSLMDDATFAKAFDIDASDFDDGSAGDEDEDSLEQRARPEGDL